MLGMHSVDLLGHGTRQLVLVLHDAVRVLAVQPRYPPAPYAPSQLCPLLGSLFFLLYASYQQLTGVTSAPLARCESGKSFDLPLLTCLKARDKQQQLQSQKGCLRSCAATVVVPQE